MLGSRRVLEDLVIAEIEEDAKTFGDKRRTKIEESEKAIVETPVIDEPVTVIFSRNGWVRARQGWEVDPATLSFKEGDSLGALIRCRTVDPVIFLDSNGRAYTIGAGELRRRAEMAPPHPRWSKCRKGPHHVLRRREAGDNGARCHERRLWILHSIADMMSNRRAGREFMTLEEGETPIAPFVYEDAAGNQVVAVSGNGRLLVFDASEMRSLARGRGVIVMGLEENEPLVAVAVTSDRRVAVTGIGRGDKEREAVLGGDKFAHYVAHRARMGRVLPDRMKPPFTLRVPPKPTPA